MVQRTIGTTYFSVFVFHFDFYYLKFPPPYAQIVEVYNGKLIVLVGQIIVSFVQDWIV